MKKMILLTLLLTACAPTPPCKKTPCGRVCDPKCGPVCSPDCVNECGPHCGPNCCCEKEK